MVFQTAVNTEQGAYIIGEQVLHGPTKSNPGVLMSDNPINNVVGRAFRRLYLEDREVSADIERGEFAGILAHPKAYQKVMDGLGHILGPTVTLPNNTNVELVTTTPGMLVELENGGNIGDRIFYDPIDGALMSSPRQVLPDHVLIHNAFVVRNHISGPRPLAIIL